MNKSHKGLQIQLRTSGYTVGSYLWIGGQDYKVVARDGFILRLLFHMGLQRGITYYGELK